jgi:formiminoglutamate deiminase
MALWFASALTAEGWQKSVRISVKDGLIAAIDAGVACAPSDERHAVALPGLPNLHSHAFQRGMAGFTEVRGAAPDTFWTWRQVMYRFLDRLTPDDVEVIASFANVEMLEAGFTRVGEFHYLHHDRDGKPYANLGEMSLRIVAAAKTTGIALTLLPVFYAHAGFGGLPPLGEQRRFVSSIDQFTRLIDVARESLTALPDAVLGVAPHSLRAVAPTELAEIVGLLPGGPVHIHVAEQLKEVEDCLAWSGKRPVAWLLEALPVDARWGLIHATHTTVQELEAMARRGATVGLCPVTEANLGDGVFQAERFAQLGGCFGIGSDANVLIDAASELAMLEYGQRLTLRRRNVMALQPERSTGRSLFDAVRRGGAKALGALMGDLVEGAVADIISLEPDLISDQQPEDSVLDRWIFASRRPALDCVWRRGERVVSGGRHVKRDAIAKRYQAVLSGLLAA